jgi:hypothetical protein
MAVVVVRTTTAILLASRRERSYSSRTEDGYEQDDMECEPSAPLAFRHGGVLLFCDSMDCDASHGQLVSPI